MHGSYILSNYRIYPRRKSWVFSEKKGILWPWRHCGITRHCRIALDVYQARYIIPRQFRSLSPAKHFTYCSMARNKCIPDNLSCTFCHCRAVGVASQWPPRVYITRHAVISHGARKTRIHEQRARSEYTFECFRECGFFSLLNVRGYRDRCSMRKWIRNAGCVSLIDLSKLLMCETSNIISDSDTFPM